MRGSSRNTALSGTRDMVRSSILKRSAVMAPVAFIVARFSPSLNARCCLKGRDGERLTPAEIGRRGEKIARMWLRSKGAKVLYNNFRAPQGGEVDIVAREGDLLLFTEVKTRTSTDFGRPLDAVNRAKRKLIRRGANEWLRLLGTREIPWRYDVIEVVLIEGERPRVNRVENVV